LCPVEKYLHEREADAGERQKNVKRKYQVTNMKGRVVQVKNTINKIEDRIWQEQES